MEVVRYDLNTAAIAKMSDIYMHLTIDGIDDKSGAAEVHSAKMIVVKHRTGINKLRLSSNKNAQDIIQKNNKDAAVLIGALAPIEMHLKAEEGKIDAEKERIRAEKKAAEKVKIEERVASLFAVGVNVPYFEIAMLSDTEYEIMLDEAINKHMSEQLRIQEEEKAKEEEATRLGVEKANQEAEANRLAEIQAAQEAEAERIRLEQEVQRLALEAEKKKIAREQAEKDAAVDAEYKKIVAEKQKMQDAKEKIEREAQERLDREVFEKQAKEDARIQAEKDAEKERIEQIAKVEKTRLRSLQAVGFVYQAKDLGTMQDKKFFALHKKHKKTWDKKQKEILAEEIEQDRLKAEAAAAAERARVEALLPDKKKIMDLAMTIRQIISPPAIKNEVARGIVNTTLYELSNIADSLVAQAEEL